MFKSKCKWSILTIWFWTSKTITWVLRGVSFFYIFIFPFLVSDFPDICLFRGNEIDFKVFKQDKILFLRKKVKFLNSDFGQQLIFENSFFNICKAS